MNSKVEIRLEAAKLAVMVEGVTPDTVVNVSREIESYVLGEAKLPEVYDPNAMLKDSINILNRRFEEDAQKVKEQQEKADELFTKVGCRAES